MVWKYLFGNEEEENKKKNTASSESAKSVEKEKPAKNGGFWGSDAGEVKGASTMNNMSLVTPEVQAMSEEQLKVQGATNQPESRTLEINAEEKPLVLETNDNPAPSTDTTEQPIVLNLVDDGVEEPVLTPTTAAETPAAASIDAMGANLEEMLNKNTSDDMHPEAEATPPPMPEGLFSAEKTEAVATEEIPSPEPKVAEPTPIESVESSIGEEIKQVEIADVQFIEHSKVLVERAKTKLEEIHTEQARIDKEISEATVEQQSTLKALRERQKREEKDLLEEQQTTLADLTSEKAALAKAEEQSNKVLEHVTQIHQAAEKFGTYIGAVKGEAETMEKDASSKKIENTNTEAIAA